MREKHVFNSFEELRFGNWVSFVELRQSFPRLMRMIRLPQSMSIQPAAEVGWAIEGPVGSDFKIDASYLSPTVALCELLESSTKVAQEASVASLQSDLAASLTVFMHR